MAVHPLKGSSAVTAFIVCTLSCVSFCKAAQAEEAIVAGSALYRERIALPADAVLDATLEESSHADAKAEVVGRASIASPGQPPIKFSIAYDSTRINPAYRYTVRAKIVNGNQVMFVADAVNVLLADTKTNVVLMLRKANPATSVARSAATLENTYWKLTHLGRDDVSVEDGQREPYFILQSTSRRLVGYGGCNALSSSYRLNGNAISLSQTQGTLVACQKNATTEQAFHRALSKVARWSITGERLELLDSKGQSVAGFESRYLK